MLRAASGDGIKGMAATPHGKDVREAGALGLVSEHVETLNRLSQEETLDIKIYVGMENHLTPDLPELVASGAGFPINGGPYILVELPFDSLPDYTDDVLSRLQEQGFTPLDRSPGTASGHHEGPLDYGGPGGAGDSRAGHVDVHIGEVWVGGAGYGGDSAEEGLGPRHFSTDCHRPTGPRAPMMAQVSGGSGEDCGVGKGAGDGGGCAQVDSEGQTDRRPRRSRRGPQRCRRLSCVVRRRGRLQGLWRGPHGTWATWTRRGGSRSPR